MSFDPKAHTRAAVLAGSIVTNEVAPTPFARREKPAIVRSVTALNTPLDLDAEVFRYLVPRPCGGHRRGRR
ncbi:MAG TPA: hypothetical protein VF698_17300 [Thermoanaerobaculia bacterium]|jgi:hypothetical protein